MIRSMIVTIFVIFGFGHVKAQIPPIDSTIQLEFKPAQLKWNHFGENQRFDESTGYEEVANSSHIIPVERLPNIKDQGGTLLCQTYCATNLIEAEYCKQIGAVNCGKLAEEERISVVSMLMYRDNPGTGPINSIFSLIDSGNREIYHILNKIASTPGEPFFFSESCFPFEAFSERVHRSYKVKDPSVTERRLSNNSSWILSGLITQQKTRQNHRQPRTAENAPNAQSCSINLKEALELMLTLTI